MGPRGKILTSLLLIIMVIIALWQFTSPVLIPSVGTKYLSSTQYANRGSWVLMEVSSYGKVFLVFSIAEPDISSDHAPDIILRHRQQGE